MRRWFISLVASWMMSSVWAVDAKATPSAVLSTQDPDRLTIMVWNIWGRSNMDPRYMVDGVTARQRVVDIIKDSGSDIVCMIETYGSAASIAKSLGYHYYTPSSGANLTIFSRYPLSNMGTPTGLSSFSFIYATVTLPCGRQVRVHNIWLTSSNSPGTCSWNAIREPEASNEILLAADGSRKRMIDSLLRDAAFKLDMAQADRIPLVVGGDFNYVSHLDYNEATVAMGLHDKRVLAIPTSLAMTDHDFIDTYRACNPLTSEKELGYTWSTVGKGWKWNSSTGHFVPRVGEWKDTSRGLFARIDYLYSQGKGLMPQSSRVVTRHRSNADNDFPHFPSDHAAVVTQFKLNATILPQPPTVVPVQDVADKEKLIFKGRYCGSKQDVSSYGIAYTTTMPAEAPATFMHVGLVGVLVDNSLAYKTSTPTPAPTTPDRTPATFTHVDLGALTDVDLRYASTLTVDQFVSYAWYYTTESNQDKVYSEIYTHTPRAMMKNGLVLYLDGNGSVENAITDDDAVAKHPAVGGKKAIYAPAPAGRGQMFDLSGDWWIDAGSPHCVVVGSFTLGLWFCPQPDSADHYCFFGTQDWTSGGNLGFGVHDGKLTSAWGEGDSRRDLSFHSDKAGTWQYLTVVVDRGENELNLYRDGVLVNTAKFIDRPTPLTRSIIPGYIDKGMALLFGRSGTSKNYPSKSYQDEIALWDRALSADEVQALFTTYKGLPLEQ